MPRLDILQRIKWSLIRLTQRPIRVDPFELVALGLGSSEVMAFATTLGSAGGLLADVGGDYHEEVARWTPTVVVLDADQGGKSATAPAIRGILLASDAIERNRPDVLACLLVWAAAMNAGYYRISSSRSDSALVRDHAFERVAAFARKLPNAPDWLSYVQRFAV